MVIIGVFPATIEQHKQGWRVDKRNTQKRYRSCQLEYWGFVVYRIAITWLGWTSNAVTQVDNSARRQRLAHSSRTNAVVSSEYRRNTRTDSTTTRPTQRRSAGKSRQDRIARKISQFAARITTHTVSIGARSIGRNAREIQVSVWLVTICTNHMVMWHCVYFREASGGVTERTKLLAQITDDLEVSNRIKFDTTNTICVIAENETKYGRKGCKSYRRRYELCKLTV